ncbi:phosphotransferase family protein [Ruegeria sp. YS9]|uniref:phosphotransferase family protein n=1 Tax=Ruegeria sp. YS9 TaxID=2966453 RepID=UPI00214CFE02|nr:phosphotransferase family protein [Ruegeria sp. YS9]UUV08313.1 phosphotransferase family protein [Ruegeria sp. YS9]
MQVNFTNVIGGGKLNGIPAEYGVSRMTSSGLELDTERLSTYLGRHIEGFAGPLSYRKFSGGQSNPTYLLKAGGSKYVLRRKPPGDLLPSAHAVDREYRVLKALHGTAVPVAKPYVLCEDTDVIGSMFYVMSFQEGRIFWNPALPELDVADHHPVFDEMIRVLAALHSVDTGAVGLSDFGKPGNYFQRQYSRWTKQYRAAETSTLPEMEQLMGWLSRNLPDGDGSVSLIHGDFRIDNFIFASDAPQIAAVLDWELSTLGHPMADLGYFCVCLRLPPTGLIRGLQGLDRAALNIPSEAEMIERYCSLRDLPEIENWTFYLAFSFFRMAAIAQGVYSRALAGNASNENAMAFKDLVAPLAQMALDEIAAATH